jgi:AcrR family transcriptional regulator
MRRRRVGRPEVAGLVSRRQREILDVATRVFAERGFRATDTQLVADAAGVGKGTLYRYFPSKEALFLAAVDRGMHRLRAEVDAAARDAADPLERIARAVRAYLGYFDANPELVELFILERSEFKHRAQPSYFEHREANEGEWKDLIRALIAGGRFRDTCADAVCDVVSNLLYGTIFVNHFAGRTRSFEQQARDILEVVFCGLLGEGERGRWLAAERPSGRPGRKAPAR